MHIVIFFKNLAVNYWLDILIVAAFIAILAIMYKRGKKEAVKKIVYSLVVKAEKELGSKTGEAKYNQVIAELYAKLPFIVRLFFTKEELDSYIKEAVDWLKIQLQDPSVTLVGYDQEQVNERVMLLEK